MFRFILEIILILGEKCLKSSIQFHFNLFFYFFILRVKPAKEIVSTNIAEMSARNTDIDLDMDGIPLSSKVKLLTQELELANRRAAESEFRMKEAIQRADFEKQRSYALDLGIQMREDRFLLFLVSIYTYPPRNPTKA